jgi:integrase
MALNHQQVAKASPRETRYRLSDSCGLYLEISASGSKLWRYRYRFLNKEKMLSLGRYPAISLTDARVKRDHLANVLASGQDPSQERKDEHKRALQVNHWTLEEVAKRWYSDKHSEEVVLEHALRNWRRLERHVFPYLGHTPTAKITPPLVLTALTRVAKQGYIETAHRVKTLIGQVMRYAIVHGLAERDPTVDIRDALPPARPQHHAALTNPCDISGLLQTIGACRGTKATCTALRLLPHLFVRPGELQKARWRDFDWTTKQWNMTAKGGVSHVVPLSSQAIDLLSYIYRHTNESEWVFASSISNNQPISNNTLNAALHRLGYKSIMTSHGFRAMARTLLAEKLRFPVEVIEMQLAHRVRDIHGRAYNRAQWFDERREMMQRWSDYLDTLSISKTL